jgi:SAM-dependent methyltransferase
MAGTFRPDNRIGRMLVSSRSLAEYRAMFALTDADLAVSILDCPGGAASFTAEVQAAGGTVTACDPAYDLTATELADLARDGMERGYQYHQANPDEYVWTYFRDPDHYRASRAASIELFTGHFATAPAHYLTAGLPTLPFADTTFDLALCSHLLFSYADRLDRAFHVDSIVELARVATEVRIFPLVPMGFATNPELASLLDELKRVRLHGTIHKVEYEFQRGGHSMLSIRG